MKRNTFCIQTTTKKTLFMVSAIDVIHEKFIAKIDPLKWKTRKT